MTVDEAVIERLLVEAARRHCKPATVDELAKYIDAYRAATGDSK